jgi:4-carboxymuconolactone decarboxylase
MSAERFKLLTEDQMTSEQKRVAAAIRSTRRDDSLGIGPFKALLRSPELADRVQRVGEYIRFKTSIPPRLNELAILITARRWTAQFEWYAHNLLAMKAGLEPGIAAAIADGRRPDRMQADETATYELCTELLETGKVSDERFQAAVEALGEQGVIDLVGAVGYYSLVAMVLNVDRCPLPVGQKPPLGPLK